MAMINRETDYAIRILRALKDGEKRPIKDICEEECMTRPFTYKIGKKLERAGILEIQRGPDGGYRLTCDLHTLNLYDLMEAIEDRQVLTDCMKCGYECTYAAGTPCRIHRNMARLQTQVNQLFLQTTIAALLE